MIHQVQAPHFTAAVVSAGGSITRAAPIVRYMSGWSVKKVEGYCKSKRWSVIPHPFPEKYLP